MVDFSIDIVIYLDTIVKNKGRRQRSCDGDQAIRILPLFDFPEESAEPAKPHQPTIFGVSVDANILHRETN
jgi:hypothetical protein